MSRKKTKNRQQSINYWQSANRNNWLYWNFFTQVQNLALSRFKWINLPATCDERFLELTLLTQGVATICTPKQGNRHGNWYSTQAVQSYPPNVYENPTKWQSFGLNGWRFDCDNSNGVLIFDNMTRLPLQPVLDMYIWELVDIAITKNINRKHQRIPFILSGSQDQKLDMINMYKQVDGGEPAIITNKDISTIKFEALQTGVNYLGEALQAEMLNVWQQIYTALGIANMPFKAERQIEDEVNSVIEPSEMQALSPLTARRYACEKLNERFEPFINEPINVVWRHDNISNNYNYMTDIHERESTHNDN